MRRRPTAIPGVLVAAGLALCVGCGADAVDGRPRPDARPAAPCLDQRTDAELASCLQTANTTVWAQEFTDAEREWTAPRLTAPDTAPQDERVADRAYFSFRTGIHVPTRYLDDLRAAHGARWRIAFSFTMAHENGHHVQNLLHRRARVALPDLEKQADCYAGFWARREAATGRLVLAAFRTAAVAELRRLSEDSEEVETHGTVDERIAALDKGIAGDDPSACDSGPLTWPDDPVQQPS